MPVSGRVPLVAVPGLGLSAAAAGRVFADLPGRTGTVVELPGYGLPAPRAVPLAPDHLARVLLARLDAAGAGRVVLLGHSASCQIVVHAALAAPRRVAALVLVGPATDPRAATWPRLAARWLRTAAWERPTQVPRLARDYHRTGLGAMARGMDAARRDRIDHALAAVEAPVLVVRGRHDRIAPQDWTQALADGARQGRAQTLSAGAHMVPLTRPAALAACLTPFLDAVPDPVPDEAPDPTA